MGFCLKCFQNCLASCCLVLMAGISFTFFDLTSATTGGLFVNVGDAIEGILQIALGDSNGGTLLAILIGGLMSITSILIFPIHWLLFYRPGEPLFALAMMLPWVLCIAISALLFAKSAKDGLFIGLFLAGGFIFWGIAIYIGLFLLLGELLGSAAIVTGLFQGLTDLPPVLAIILSSIEGGLIGGAFGAFIGSLKYKPSKEEYIPGEPEDKGSKRGKKEKKDKKNKKNDSFTVDSGPVPGVSADQLKKCPHCGKMIKKDLKYCINCENFLG